MNYAKNILIGILCLAIGFVAERMYIQASQVAGATQSAVGTTFNSAKIAATIFAPSTAAATSTSILNTDSTDRIIESSVIDCNTVGTSQTFTTGAGLASFLIRSSTTTVSSTGFQGNTNYSTNINLATTTPDIFVSSSTEPVLFGVGRIWPTGTYLTFGSNATNTASCVIGVHYLAQ